MKNNKLFVRIKNSKYRFYYILIFLIIFIFLLLLIPSSKGISILNTEINHQKVCKFTTVKAFYHNVGKTETDAKGLGKIFFNHGYKKFWIEYDGTVDLSLNCDEVKIKKHPFDNTFYITLPKKVTVENPKVLGNTMSDGITDKGIFTKITAEEKKMAKNQAKSQMVLKAQEDEELHKYTIKRTKSLIENYIISIGNLKGKKYKVVFK